MHAESNGQVAAEADDEFAAAEEAISGLRSAVELMGEGEFGVLTESLRLARRAFDEIGKCNSVLDAASAAADDLTNALDEQLRCSAAEEVTALIDELAQLARTVANSEAERAVVLRIVHGEADDEDMEDDAESVPVLWRSDLPAVPSVYDADQADYASLEDMLRRQGQLHGEQKRIRAERLRLSADHLRSVFAYAADHMATVAAAEAAIKEARRAHEMWAECLADGPRNAASDTPGDETAPARDDDAPELVAVFEIHADSNEDVWAQATWQAKLAACKAAGIGEREADTYPHTWLGMGGLMVEGIDGRRFEARVTSRESGERPWFVPRRIL
ncbi:hypothetical protein [Streptomyces sp. NPDC001070]